MKAHGLVRSELCRIEYNLYELITEADKVITF